MSCLVAHEEKEGWHRMRIWLKKYTKRFLCQKFFLFLLIALPFFTYLYSYAVHQKSTKVKVGIVADRDDVFVREIQEELLSKTGMITFCEISSEKDMIQKIRKGDLTCGYVFPDTLKKQYENGQYEKCIKQYNSEGNAFFLIAREAVISSVFRVYGRQMLEDYIAQSGLFESHEIQKGEISQKYKDNLEKQQTFTMEINKQNFAKKQMGDYLLAPLHGGVAFLILLAGFCGLALYRKDCGRQIPFAVTGKWRREMSLFSIAVPVVLMTISGIFSELLCGITFLTIKEIASLLIYDIMVVLFCDLLSAIRVKEGVIWLFALFYLCISVLFTPVFLNLSVLIPWAHVLSYFCLPYYFLNAAFGGVWQIFELIFAGALLFLVNIWRRRRDCYGY